MILNGTYRLTIDFLHEYQVSAYDINDFVSGKVNIDISTLLL